MTGRELIDDRFQIIQKIGQGSFGIVYRAFDHKKGIYVAMKTENLNKPNSHLLKEIQHCKLFEDGPGFPKLVQQGISLVEPNKFLYMATELLGPTIDDLFRLCGNRFSLKTTLMIFYSLLKSVEFIHSKDFIHRDIKPDNLLMGMGENSDTLYMIDYGISRSIIDPKTGEHIPFATDKQLVGTSRFISVNSHRGYEVSRRDDLITLGYVILNLFKGRLPWQGFKLDNQNSYRQLGLEKASYSNKALCESCPKQFEQYMDYVTDL